VSLISSGAINQVISRALLIGGIFFSSCGAGSVNSPIAHGNTPEPSASQGVKADRSSSEATPAPSPKSDLSYETFNLPRSVVHVVTVPPDSGRKISVAISDELTTLPEIAQAKGAIAVINAGFFDPQNGLTTSYVTVDGAIVANPQQNDRLIQNPDLQPYLPVILNRSEFRIYDCLKGLQYDIVRHTAPTPQNCSLRDAVGAGPQLLPTMTGYEEGFLADNEAGERIRDALGSETANARSAIGIKADGTVVWAIASQVPDVDSPTGLTLAEMVAFLQDLGVQQALNLDGGSSSGLYVNGETYLGRIDASGQPIERPLKSVLLVH